MKKVSFLLAVLLFLHSISSTFVLAATTEVNTDTNVESDIGELIESEVSEGVENESLEGQQKVEEQPEIEQPVDEGLEEPEADLGEVEVENNVEEQEYKESNQLEEPINNLQEKNNQTDSVEQKQNESHVLKQNLNIQIESTPKAISSNEKNISKLGYIKTEKAMIYPKLGVNTNSFSANKTYLNKIYYIKKQATLNNKTYYLISERASATQGIIGWVQAADMTVQNHLSVDKRSKTFHVKGTGKAYLHAWGQGNDIAYDNLARYNHQIFKVDLTEKVGEKLWYRGVLAGKTVWIESNNVATLNEDSTSKLGKIRTSAAKIYPEIGVPSRALTAGNTYTNITFYIKKQANIGKDIYYLLSNQPSSKNGLVGWIRAEDINVYNHSSVDRYDKPFIIKGTGSGYSKAWGGEKDIVSKDLSNYKGQVFYAHLTEKVGNETWYRGRLEGKTTWLKSNQLVNASPVEIKTSKLGRIKTSTAKIYPSLNSASTAFTADKANLDKVFYIKKEAKLGNLKFYLISNSPSSVNGLVGWINVLDVNAQDHVSVDKIQKRYKIMGNGQSYTHAWGASKNIVYNNLASYAGKDFIVNLTEKVGSDFWYRGTLNGKTMWIHPKHLLEKNEKSVSLLGHINNSNVRIYDLPSEPNNYKNAGVNNVNSVHYIKKSSVVNGETYYLLSPQARITSGTTGWVKAKDIAIRSHTSVDKLSKTFYISGSGSAYLHAWGGSKDVVYKNLSQYQSQTFEVHLTEKVGNETWYRGILNGKTIWIEAKNLTTLTEKPVSKLGKIKTSSVKIYSNLANSSSSVNAGNNNMDKVFYIKKQATVNNTLYYLLSEKPSSVSGLVGWVKSQDLIVNDHMSVDKKNKLFYVTGVGSAYTKAWGDSKDIVYKDLAQYRHQKFHINLTEKVGNEIWYRGTLGGKTVWIQENNVSNITESSTSKLGKIKTSYAKIYPEIGVPSTAITTGTQYLDKVFYIKKQAKVGNDLYYLLSNSPSSTTGLVGWIRDGDVEVQNHASVDKKNKVLYISGIGSAYSKAWGGKKDVVYSNLSQYKNEVFNVHLTEKVGTALWYRGTLHGKTVWIQAANLAEQGIQYTEYNITLNSIVEKQMQTNPPPQTDLYRNQNGYIANSDVTISKGGAITGSGVNLRSQPNTTSSILANVGNGTVIKILDTVTGQVVSGSTKWYKIEYNKKTMYVHSSLASANAITATTNKKTKVYANANSGSHVYLTLNANTKLTLVKEGTTYHTISVGTWRNAMKSDVNYYLNPNNNDIYQHLILSKTAGLSAADLRAYLNGKGILSGRGQAFIDGAKQYNVNEIYLMFHALLETGNGGSTLANGVYVNKSGQLIMDSNGHPILDAGKVPAGSVKVYNMFGIGAIDSNPTVGGAKYAFQNGWTTPEKAIIGGAKWISVNYINHSTYKQDTLYKMKWNPAVPASHQYATDIGWAVKQAARLKELYKNYTNAASYFDIPRYK